MNNINEISKKSYRVAIFDDVYTLVTDETEETVKTVAKQVDTFMKEIATKAPTLDVKKIAVLVALRYASLLAAKEVELEHIDSQHKRIIALVDSSL